MLSINAWIVVIVGYFNKIMMIDDFINYSSMNWQPKASHTRQSVPDSLPEELHPSIRCQLYYFKKRIKLNRENEIEENVWF